jgi:hypothetical protein
MNALKRIKNQQPTIVSLKILFLTMTVMFSSLSFPISINASETCFEKMKQTLSKCEKENKNYHCSCDMSDETEPSCKHWHRMYPKMTYTYHPKSPSTDYDKVELAPVGKYSIAATCLTGGAFFFLGKSIQLIHNAVVKIVGSSLTAHQKSILNSSLYKAFLALEENKITNEKEALKLIMNHRFFRDLYLKNQSKINPLMFIKLMDHGNESGLFCEESKYLNKKVIDQFISSKQFEELRATFSEE